MPLEFASVPDWAKGDILSAQKFQQMSTATTELQDQVRGLARKRLPAIDLDSGSAGTQRWQLVSRTTRIERFEDADDEDIYVEVLVPTQFVYLTPEGVTVTLPLE